MLIENDTRCVVIDAEDRPPSLCVSRPGPVYAFWNVRAGVGLWESIRKSPTLAASATSCTVVSLVAGSYNVIESVR